MVCEGSELLTHRQIAISPIPTNNNWASEQPCAKRAMIVDQHRGTAGKVSNSVRWSCWENLLGIPAITTHLTRKWTAGEDWKHPGFYRQIWGVSYSLLFQCSNQEQKG